MCTCLGMCHIHVCIVTTFPLISSSIVHTLTVLPFSLVRCVLRSFQSRIERYSSRLSIAVHCCSIWMDHGLFNQSPVEGPLGCFLPSAVTDNVLMSCRVHASFQNFANVTWKEIPRVWLVGQRVNAYVILPLLDKFPASGIVPFCIAPRTEWDFLFL